jgi:hypothetical protein
LEVESEKAHDGQSLRRDVLDVSAIKRYRCAHPPWQSEDAYLQKGKTGRDHVYSARGRGVSPCGHPLKENRKDEIQRMY